MFLELVLGDMLGMSIGILFLRFQGSTADGALVGLAFWLDLV